MSFEPTKGAAVGIGSVIRVLDDGQERYFRITHEFATSVFVMGVSTPAGARYARRPVKWSHAVLERVLGDPQSSTGHLSLPPEAIADAGDLGQAEEVYRPRLAAIAPLVDHFDKETNLLRSRFAAAIEARAQELAMPVIVVRRLLLRYYYFGRNPLGLMNLRSGPRRQETVTLTTFQPRRGKRRGRKAIDELDLGPNTFVVAEDDISDMVECVQSATTQGVTYITERHDHYLKTAFNGRHPQEFAAYVRKECPCPVTLAQFRRYIKLYAELTPEQLHNLPSRRASRPRLGSGHANGPGDTYEIDATGGRIFIVDPADPEAAASKPTIYFVIDRWSRYIVGFYATLKAPSWEEVRCALLVALTSRQRRFGALGFDVTDDDWPIGVVPASLTQDRGSEFLSTSMAAAAAESLRIELCTLPPLCPDGKSIVERLHRTFKQQMLTEPGTYAERPLDPQTKQVMRSAKVAAVRSLRDLYRKLLEFVDLHNNSPHSHLRTIPALRAAGSTFTPNNAYQWGLENVSGMRPRPLGDNDFKRLLLATESASIAAGVVSFMKRRYIPANAEALRVANSSAMKRSKLNIRVDRSDPGEIWTVSPGGMWGSWTINEADALHLNGSTLEEEDALAKSVTRQYKRSENQARINRLSQDPNRALKAAGATIGNTAIKSRLLNRPSGNTAESPPKKPADWEVVDQQERLAIIERMKARRT